MKTVAWFGLCAAVVLVACGDDGDAGQKIVCGDGNMQGNELCDDGNLDNGDGCSAYCQWEPGWNCAAPPCVTVCGDGYTKGAEVCDPKQTPGYCSADCSQVTGSCGDGKVQEEVESCDPGSGAIVGCKDCDPAFTFTCDKSKNTCKASGLAPDKKVSDLTKDETHQYCEWLINALGGEGDVWQCAGYQMTNYTYDVCVSKQYGNWGVLANCTVAQIEAWAASQGNRCSLMTGSPPCAT